VQCDVERTSNSASSYRCYVRLRGSSALRVCLFEATRSRKGKLANSHYRLSLPKDDPRLRPSGEAAIPGEDPLYCGKLRSYSMSGSNFVVYDDGVKVEEQRRLSGSSRQPPPGAERTRNQLAAMIFQKSSSRRAPMSMRVLVPSVGHATSSLDLLDSLQSLPPDSLAAPPMTELLRLVPPRWNEEEQMYQLSYEGRACCMSNKNVQLANAADEELAALQVGKLRKNLFNVDLGGCLSPFQAFGIALAIFDQSSVRRRF